MREKRERERMRFRGAKNEKREWEEERVSVFVCFERERVF
jgi:hypothetical protein